MAINVTNNGAVSLAFGAASSVINFTTDATPAVQTTVTGNAGDNKFTPASLAGLVQGDLLSIENAGVGGAKPWVAVVNGFSGALVLTNTPSTRVAASGNVANRLERFETRFRAKKVVLTNLTTGDTYTWTDALAQGAATNVSGGVTTSLPYSAIYNRSDAIFIHPNILPVSSSFTLYSEYDYAVSP